MLPISFQITALEHGWLFAELVSPTENLSFANSCLWGETLPKAFLHSLIVLLEGNSPSQWLCWHAESHAHIWKMSAHDYLLHLEIYRIDSDIGLPVYGDDLADRVRSVMPEQTIDADMHAFARTACDSFGKYKSGEGQGQWNDSGFGNFFPTEEYRKLRRLLKGK